MRAALRGCRPARARDQAEHRLQGPQRRVERGYPMTGFSEDDFKPREGTRREQAGNGNGAPRDDDDAEHEKIERGVVPEHDAATERAELEKASKDNEAELLIQYPLDRDISAADVDAPSPRTPKQ